MTVVVPATTPSGPVIPTLSSPVFNCSIEALSVKVSVGRPVKSAVFTPNFLAMSAGECTVGLNPLGVIR